MGPRNGVLALLVVCFLLGPMSMPVAGQDTVGVTPATLSFQDPPLLPGGSKVGVLHFQQQYDEPVSVDIEVEGPGTAVGNAKPWVSLSHEGTITVAPTNDFPVNVTVTVPETAADGVYEAGVRFRVTPPSSDSGDGSGATTETAVTARIVIEVDNENQVQRVEVDSSPAVFDTEESGPFQFTVPLSNTGNVDANPRVLITIQDKFQEAVVATHWFNDTLLSPGESRDQSYVVPELGLPLDQYWATVEVFLGGELVFTSGAQTFDVVAEGSLSRAAELRTILVDGGSAFARVGQLIKLSAMVENTGQAPVVAQFKGEVHRDGALVDTIESDAIEVPIGQERALDMFYTADAAGRYEFIGRVHYDNKLTEEKSLIVTMSGSGPFDVPWLWVAIGVAGVFVGLVAMAVLRRRRGNGRTGPQGAGRRRGGAPGGAGGRRGPPGGAGNQRPRPGRAPRDAKSRHRPAGPPNRGPPGCRRPPH